MTANKNPTQSLIETKLVVVNVGLESLVTEAEIQDVPVIFVTWKPNADNDPSLAWELAEMGA